MADSILMEKAADTAAECFYLDSLFIAEVCVKTVWRNNLQGLHLRRAEGFIFQSYSIHNLTILLTMMVRMVRIESNQRSGCA